MRPVLSAFGKFLANAWFPATLILLFLLTLPGVFFFILHLNGQEIEANEWLQKNFRISYHLILPSWVCWLFILLPVVIVLLYFLKLKRRPIQVPSTFLWKKSVEDLHVNTLFQMLKRNVLLLLQLLICLVLLYAVMGFRIYGTNTKGQHYIIMIDNSASMAARDLDGMTRLEKAKQEALKQIGAHSPSDIGMVVVFNSRATTLSTYTSNQGRLKAAVESIEQTQRPTRILEALNLADGLANPLASTENVAAQPENAPDGQEQNIAQPKQTPTDVYLYSDGRFPDLSESALAKLNSRQVGNTSVLGNLTLYYQRIGLGDATQTRNVGITSFTATRLTDKKGAVPDLATPKLQLLVQINNFSGVDTNGVRLVLDVQENGVWEYVTHKDIDLPKRLIVTDPDKENAIVKDEPGEVLVTFRPPAVNVDSHPVFRVTLENANDQFGLDDKAWLAIARPRKAKVLLITSGNRILDAAYFIQKPVDKLATVSRMSPNKINTDEYRQLARSSDYDLIIFDRCGPKKVEEMPESNTLFIDQPPPPWIRGDDIVSNPTLTVSRPNHPLLQDLTTLWDVAIDKAFSFDTYKNLHADVKDKYANDPSDPKQKGKTIPPTLTTLIEGPKKMPVLFTIPRRGYTDLVTAFPITKDRGLVTNWPVQPSFPLFLRKVIIVLGNVGDAIRTQVVRPGDEEELWPEAGIKELTIAAPDDSKETIQRSGGPKFVYTETESTGIYSVYQDKQMRGHFVINLLDANESNIHPKPQIKIGDETVRAGSERETPREIWKWIVLAGLVLLGIEWYIYNRRVTI